MDDNFNIVWNNIQSRLMEGSNIRVWSAANDYNLDRTFRVEEVEPGAVTISSDRTSFLRRITMSDFANVHARWADYCVGRLPRHELRDLSQNTTYIIGILRWREAEAAPVLTG
jgi:hypothetical protein